MAETNCAGMDMRKASVESVGPEEVGGAAKSNRRKKEGSILTTSRSVQLWKRISLKAKSKKDKFPTGRK